jgi:hypothetical protein
MTDDSGRIEWRDDQGRTWVLWDGWFRRAEWPDGIPDERTLAKETARLARRVAELEAVVEKCRLDVKKQAWDYGY